MSGLPAKTVAVIGVGRFGRLWASMLRGDFDVEGFDSTPETRAEAAAQGFSSAPLRSALSSDVIFYCVPISAFEATLSEHVQHFAALEGGRTLIDVLSVKV